MNKKEILRKIIVIFCILVVLKNSALFLQGKTPIFSICGFTLMVVYVVWGLVLAVTIIDRIQFFRQYKIAKEYFEYLQMVHKKRYQSYFPYNKEKVDEYSEEIQKYGSDLLKVENIWLEKRKMTQKQRLELVNMLSKTKEIMTKDLVQ